MVVSKNVFVRGRRTSMRLEPEMWGALFDIAQRERRTLHELVSGIAAGRGRNLTSTVRCFVIRYYLDRVHEAERQAAAAASLTG